MNTGFRVFLTLIASFLAYYIFNWHIATWLGLPFVTLPWFFIIAIVFELLGNFSYTYKSYPNKDNNNL